jgi:hypothetical protein
MTRIDGPHLRTHRILAATAVIAACLLACKEGKPQPIVGSDHVVAKTMATMVVESVGIFIPFKAVVHNGAARKIVVRGEDNLLSHITIRETSVSHWEIVAPYDFPFKQHSDMQIEIPFLDMVQISYDADLMFADKPFETVRQNTADAGGM